MHEEVDPRKGAFGRIRHPIDEDNALASSGAAS
jgi:hypothetical protein